MTIADTKPIIATSRHVEDFINNHDDSVGEAGIHSDFYMNKALLNAIIDRIGGVVEFAATYNEKKIENDHPSSLTFNYKYRDADNLKFWDDNRANIIDGLERGARHAGEESAVAMVGFWFEDTKHCPQHIKEAFIEPACDYDVSSPARKEVCSWLSLAAITDAFVDFFCFMDGRQ